MEERRRGQWQFTLAALFVGVVIFGFQQTAITPALPVVQRDLDSSREWATWLLSGYFIVASVTPVFLGKLADLAGKRRILLVALLAFLLGSVGAAISPSIGLVVVCRLVQGLGGAVFPLAFAIARDEVPARRIGDGIGILSGGFGVGALLGYGLGGLITQTLGWRWIFGIGAIVLVIAVILVRLTVPDSETSRSRSLDSPGAVLFGVALSGLIIGITEGPQRGWGAALPVAMFVLAAVAAAAWVYRELHTDQPLMDLRVLGSRAMLLTNVVSLISGYSAIGTGVLLTFLIQGSGSAQLTAFGLVAGPLLTGLLLLPRALGQSIGSPLTGPLTRRFGQPRVLGFGMALTAAGLFALAFWRGSAWVIAGELAIIGLGFGLAVAVMSSLATLGADRSESGVSAAMNSVLRRVGGGIGAQVGVALLATFTIADSADPAPGGFTVAFLVAAGTAVAGAVCALLIAPRRQLAAHGSV